MKILSIRAAATVAASCAIVVSAMPDHSVAQHAAHPAAAHPTAAHPAAAQQSGYAGMQSREIKALSPEQVADLREGRGMGASLPAELNGVPGPLHVLQLAQQLEVTPPQRDALERLTAEMKVQAQHLGAQLIVAEETLDRAFRTRSIDERGVQEATRHIASLQGQLRAVHLVAHLKTRGLLSDEQVAAYNRARGYAATTEPVHRH